MPAHRDGAACTGAGVRKPPKNEVAGSWAPAKQRPLSEFNAGAALDGKRDASMRRRAMSVQQRTAGELIDGVLLREAATRQNASTTSAFWHERCKRGDLMFLARVISNSCAWQKQHIRQPLRD